MAFLRWAEIPCILMFDFASHLSNIASHLSNLVSLLSLSLKLLVLLFCGSVLWRLRKIIIKLLKSILKLLKLVASRLIAHSLPEANFSLTSFDWKYWCVVWSGIYDEVYVTETRKRFVEVSPGGQTGVYDSQEAAMTAYDRDVPESRG